MTAKIQLKFIPKENHESNYLCFPGEALKEIFGSGENRELQQKWKLAKSIFISQPVQSFFFLSPRKRCVRSIYQHTRLSGVTIAVGIVAGAICFPRIKNQDLKKLAIPV